MNAWLMLLCAAQGYHYSPSTLTPQGSSFLSQNKLLYTFLWTPVQPQPRQNRNSQRQRCVLPMQQWTLGLRVSLVGMGLLETFRELALARRDPGCSLALFCHTEMWGSTPSTPI